MKQQSRCLFLLFSFPLIAAASTMVGDGVLAVDNFQGGLPSSQTAQRYAKLNLDIELAIARMRADFSCYVIPYDDGYKVLWLVPPGVAISAKVKAQLEKMILDVTLGGAEQNNRPAKDESKP